MEDALLQKTSPDKSSTVSVAVSVAGASEDVGGDGWRRCVLSRREFTAEMKKMMEIAAPMVAVTVSQYLMQVVSMSMVGHLGELALSGVSVATSLASVTGFSVLFGMAGALETLCGQAFGAEQYQKLGTYTYSSVITLLLLCIPISILWLFMDKLLILFGQDPGISAVAYQYIIYLIPALFGFGILESLIRYFQSQSLISPMLWATLSALFLHVCLCWVLVHKLGAGVVGAAVSLGVAYWVNAILLWIYKDWSSTCEKSRAFDLSDVLSKIKEFFCFALPSAMMMCLELWSFEFMILLSGLLPNSQLETSVLSICLTTTTLHYYFIYGVGAAASVRVSNELGAGNPRDARVAVTAAVAVAGAEAILIGITLICFRRIWGYVYSNEKEVVELCTWMTPLLCLSVIFDSMVAIFSGVARGTGWQHLGAVVNIGAYYLVGIPIGAVLCFVMEWEGRGLWVGVLSGSALQAFLLGLITSLTNWHKQAMKARERLLDSRDGHGLLA
ncbi:PREDICTED: protein DETOXIFICATION 8-like [Tarenaya hassleriana]|uniref:protein DETOXIFICATION 8-like n=1 Tax=Tarenaya hassleriana TaxID=28532 RepID=UPI00053C0C5B|nr:PREDICTED: protein DETOXIFICATION 8-like [Tarenaya hassleriana]